MDRDFLFHGWVWCEARRQLFFPGIGRLAVPNKSKPAVWKMIHPVHWSTASLSRLSPIIQSYMYLWLRHVSSLWPINLVEDLCFPQQAAKKTSKSLMLVNNTTTLIFFYLRSDHWICLSLPNIISEKLLSFFCPFSSPGGVHSILTYSISIPWSFLGNNNEKQFLTTYLILLFLRVYNSGSSTYIWQHSLFLPIFFYS